MKKTVYALLAATLTVTMAACSSSPASTSSDKASTDASAEVSNNSQSADSQAASKETPSEAPVYVVSDYLSKIPMSRAAMIAQLEYLGYDTHAAEIAVDEYGADWVEQAKRTLDEMEEKVEGDDAIQALLDKGFTQEEAEAAVKK